MARNGYDQMNDDGDPKILLKILEIEEKVSEWMAALDENLDYAVQLRIYDEAKCAIMEYFELESNKES